MCGVLIILVMRMLAEMAVADPSTGSFADCSRKAPGAGFAYGDAALAKRLARTLVVGPSSSAPAARVFLGSRALKIVRSASVPVCMAPGPHTR